MRPEKSKVATCDLLSREYARNDQLNQENSYNNNKKAT